MISKRMQMGINRGLRQRCPECGKGKMYASYLKVHRYCGACSHELTQYPSDDAPPYLTIAIVGHVIIPAILWFESTHQHTLTVSFLFALSIITAATLAILPFVKGMVLGYMWALQMKRKRD